VQAQNHTLYFETTAGTDIVDITPAVLDRFHGFGFETGVVNLFIPGSTASLTTIEYESGAIQDLKQAIDRIAPHTISYQHDLRWGDGNGYSHVRAALLGPSLSIPVIDGSMTLGTWQQIVLVDFDNRPRKRGVILQMLEIP